MREPRWWSAARWRLLGVTPALRAWLLDETSLTRRLQLACPGRFRVRLLSLRRARPAPGERRALNMRLGEYGLIREVHLLCGDTPWVYARTVIPQGTLSGPQRRLARLGNKPLGAALFAERSMRRDAVEIARYTRSERGYGVATAGLNPPPAAIWGRRSVFRLRGKPLLVSEVFLPSLLTVDE